MIKTIIKRDGREVPFDVDKITSAIYKAAKATGGRDHETAARLGDMVAQYFENNGNFSENFAPYTLIVFYEAAQDDFVTTSPQQHFPYMMPMLEENAETLFDLIENLQAVTFSFSFNFPYWTAIEGEEQQPVIYSWNRSRCGESSIRTPLTEGQRIWTIEELGETIVQAGVFWEDWWNFSGIFDGAVDFSTLAPSEIIFDGGRVLPASGFGNLSDLRAFLLNFYTETQVDKELSDEFPRFAEYNGNLYTNGTRAGFARPDWSTATHDLVGHEGNRQYVTTTVLYGGWHRTDLNPMDYAWEMYYHFTFIDGRIDSYVRMGEVSVASVACDYPTIVLIDLFNRMPPSAWASFHEIDYNSVRGNIFDELITLERLEQGIGGDTLVIWVNNPITDFMLIGFYHGHTEDGDMQTSVSDFLYAIPELHPDKPVMLTSYFGVGTFPLSGIAFTDHDGSRRHFFIVQDQSGYGNPYRLMEFEPWSC